MNNKIRQLCQKKIEQGSKKLGFNLSKDQIRLLVNYITLLNKWNGVYNLTAINDPEKMVSHHILDSLAALPAFKNSNKVLDVGSGAGFPGIVLAIVYPSLLVCLIDSVQKKTAFLTQVKAVLGLDNIIIYTGRVENLSVPEKFDAITSRAFSDLSQLINLSSHLLSEKGSFIAMKGVLPKEEIASIPDGWFVSRIIPLNIPELRAERHLIIIKKETIEAKNKNAKIFCVANQKGGVGKTTTAVNLAAALSKLGQKVLLVDLDPQGNATMGSGINKTTIPLSVYQVLIGEADVNSAKQTSEVVEYHVLASNRELAGAELEMVDFEDRESRLKNALAQVQNEYDFILIDCPPALSLLTLNAFCCAHGVIIPMQCEYYALEGLTDLTDIIRRVQSKYNPNLQIIGLLRVMYDPRMMLTQQVSEQLEEHFGDKVFTTLIPRNVRLAEAPSYGMPGVVFDPVSRGAQAYIEFGTEMIERIKTLG